MLWTLPLKFGIIDGFWNLGLYFGSWYWPYRMSGSTLPLRSGMFLGLLYWVSSRPSLKTLALCKLEKKLLNKSVLHSWEFHCRLHWKPTIFLLFTVQTLPDSLYFQELITKHQIKWSRKYVCGQLDTYEPTPFLI